ncbi:MAG: hypothetical protein JF887_02730 [Candidatus Dormibacteraeota bacterium]|uniref:Uncharacterized protein n=1 Tax=Candidatus Amunia macphersoniae TaxID=3127014 RepID=A0A934KLW2_9BACT|nr:hypothetical protein [Candidatus Dormibacteraeota bacterium]
MALHVTPAADAVDAVDTVEGTRERIIELVGMRTAIRRTPVPIEETPVVLSLQLEAIDNFVEIVRLRTDIAEKDRRIGTLTVGLRAWRERAGSERADRLRDAAEAAAREREIISLLHQQMQCADAATAELEHYRSRRWWRRLRG